MPHSQNLSPDKNMRRVINRSFVFCGIGPCVALLYFQFLWQQKNHCGAIECGGDRANPRSLIIFVAVQEDARRYTVERSATQQPMPRSADASVKKFATWPKRIQIHLQSLLGGIPFCRSNIPRT